MVIRVVMVCVLACGEFTGNPLGVNHWSASHMSVLPHPLRLRGTGVHLSSPNRTWQDVCQVEQRFLTRAREPILSSLSSWGEQRLAALLDSLERLLVLVSLQHGERKDASSVMESIVSS